MSNKSHLDAVSRAIYGPPSLDPVRRHDPHGRRGLNSKYDAAQDDTGNQRHWADADGLSGRQANSPDVRRKLRERARLEFDNGPTCKGPIESIGHDLVGTGPRLQLKPPDGVPEETVKFIERQFQDWADDPAVDLADRLRVMVESELRDGESFALLVTNELVGHPVKLSLRLVEAEQVATPDLWDETEAQVDGIQFDAAGNPLRYAILNSHPGEGYNWNPGDYRWWPAELVLHWFRPNRASHARGIPRIAPGLAIHAHRRAYTRSTLGAARLAATMAGVIKTNLPPDDGPVVLDEYDVVPFNHEGLFTIPQGWDVGQLKAEQPTATYEGFNGTLLAEFGRSIHSPRNKVTGDSSPYNYSSARLDDIDYRGTHRVERNRLAIAVLDRVFAAWWAEAVALPDFIPDADSLPPLADWSWAWQYDGAPSIDPVKDETATQIAFQTNSNSSSGSICSG